MSMIGVARLLGLVAEAKKREDKINILRENDTIALRTILVGALDKNVKFSLPEGQPPYRENNLPAGSQEHMLHSQARTFYVFVEGQTDIKQIKREAMFIQLLESLDPDDAKLVIAMKDKKIPYKGITRALVNEAFPGLVAEDESVKEEA